MGSGGVERMACEEVSCCAADNAAACKGGGRVSLVLGGTGVEG